MEKKVPILEENATPATVVHSKYDNSLTCHELCSGCNKMFTHSMASEADPDVLVESSKCVSYCNPAAMWPKKGQQFATKLANVRVIGKDGRAAIEAQEVPILEKYCPLASHYVAIEVIKSSRKVLVGQQKQGRG